MSTSDKELRERLAALKAQNASLKKQKALADEIAALQAENETIGALLAGEDPSGEPETATAVTIPEERANAQPEEAVAASGASEEQPVVRRRGGRARRVLVGVLIALSCLAVVVSGVTIWTHYSVMNTDGYMRLVGPVGKDPETIRALSDYVATQVVTATDLQERTAEALPPKAQFLAGPITGAVNGFIADGTDKILSTDKAYDLWLRINRLAHEKIVALLRGDTTYAYIEGDDVRLDTLPLISQVLVWLDGKLPGGLASKFSPPVIEPGTDPATAIQQVSTWTGRPLPPDFGQVTLLKSDSLGPAQTAVRVFDALVWIIPIVTLVLIAVTIWLSRNRRRTIITLGVGVAVALILTRVIVKKGSAAIIDGLGQTNGVRVVRNVVDASLGPLTTITIWIVVIAVVVVIAAWFAGRRDLQDAVVATGKRVLQREGDTGPPDSPVAAWIVRNVQFLRWIGLVVGLLLLAFFAWSWLGLALIVGLALLYEVVLSLLARQWPFGSSRGADEEVA
jgi:hypothetical protein